MRGVPSGPGMRPLGSAMMLLLLVPLISLAAGATGAVIADRWGRPNHRAV